MSLVVRRFDRMRRELRAPYRHVCVAWTTTGGLPAPSRQNLVQKPKGKGGREWAVGGNDDSASLLFANFEHSSYYPWNRTLASFSKTSQAVLVISFPTMLFFSLSFFWSRRAPASSRSLRHHAIGCLGILCLPPRFFFSQDVSRDHDPISLRSLRPAHLDFTHTSLPF